MKKLRAKKPKKLNFTYEFVVQFVEQFFGQGDVLADQLLLKRISNKLEEMRVKENEPNRKALYTVLVMGINQTLRNAHESFMVERPNIY